MSVSLLSGHVGQPRQLLFPLGNQLGQLGRRFLLLKILRAQRLHLRRDGAAVLHQQLTKERPGLSWPTCSVVAWLWRSASTLSAAATSTCLASTQTSFFS
ncbi:hypothetical protein ACWXV6_12935 [Pantoea ananatis]